jgi:hypothetical protein
MTTSIRVRCDSCERYASLGPGIEPEALEAAGWRVVRDEATCPTCAGMAAVKRAGPGHRLSGLAEARPITTHYPAGDTRSPRHAALVREVESGPGRHRG